MNTYNMAFGGSEGDILEVNMLENNGIVTGANASLNDQNMESNTDECINNSDSLSSSASISDSDLTSTDSEDSLALSESESITDVTPLNSPYCDSPLPPSRLLEHKPEDKVFNNQTVVRYVERGADCCPPEMNVLMQAIEKLEMEAKKAEQPPARANSLRKRTVSYSGDEGKKVELENQRLFKRVISQQNRIRAIYPTTSQSDRKHPSVRKHLSVRKHQELVKSEGDISALPKNIQSTKFLKDETKYSQRQQKCLSHPSCTHSRGYLGDKLLLNADLTNADISQNTNEKEVKATTSATFKVTKPPENYFSDQD